MRQNKTRAKDCNICLYAPSLFYYHLGHMETKLSTADHMGLLKTLARNYWLFWRKAKNNKGFFSELEEMAHMGNLASVREELPFINTDISIIEAFAYYPMSHETILNIGKKIKSQMTIGHIMDMEEMLDTWMDKLDFGPEWRETLVTLITTGILCPPIYTFHIDTVPAKKSRKSDQKLVRITLSPETSIDELRLAWKLQIQKMKHDSWPDFKKVNLADGLKKHLMEEVAVEKAKSDLSHEFKFPDLNEIERQATKHDTDPNVVKRKTMEYRRKMREVANVKIKPFKVRLKKTFVDVAVELHGALKNKDKKKKADLLRQHKHRSKV